MGTHSLIGIAKLGARSPNGEITSIYCHQGSLKDVSEALLTFYNRGNAEELIKLGDLISLNLKGAVPSDPYTPAETHNFYTWPNRFAVITYEYLYMAGARMWYVRNALGENRHWRRLTLSAVNLLETPAVNLLETPAPTIGGILRNHVGSALPEREIPQREQQIKEELLATGQFKGVRLEVRIVSDRITVEVYP